MDDFRSRIVGRIRKMIDSVQNGEIRSFVVGGGASEEVAQIRNIGTVRSESDRPALCGWLEDLSPAIRRNAAWALGRIGSKDDAAVLMGSAKHERCDMPRLMKCVAAVRCGAPVTDAWEIVEYGAKRSFEGFYGERKTADVTGWGVDDVAALWIRCLSSSDDNQNPASISPEPVDDIRARLHRSIEDDPDNRNAVLNLGLLGHPEDFDLLYRMIPACGRRMHLTLCAAFGYHGDLRSVEWLLRVLTAVDENPGHGFASRAAAAAALGSLGDPGVADKLVRALADEQRDYEGRPGAGLGIQRSVRTSILGALGELQKHPHILEGYLADTDGSAAGGFYLVAMDGLWKIGDRQRLVELNSAPDEISINARAVLRELEGHSDVEVLPVP